jgi:aspartate/methionine/tyrosine aminotransferase
MASLQGMRERVITVNGFSKAYSMTGWRLGYVAAPADLVQLMIRVHQYTTVCAVTFAQAGAAAAYEGEQTASAAMVSEFARRRRILLDGLATIPGVSCSPPRGAFYAFADIRATGSSAADLTNRLLEDAGVAVVSGDEFGASGAGHIRLSYATSEADIREGIERMRELLGAH